MLIWAIWDTIAVKKWIFRYSKIIKKLHNLAKFVPSLCLVALLEPVSTILHTFFNPKCYALGFQIFKFDFQIFKSQAQAWTKKIVSNFFLLSLYFFGLEGINGCQKWHFKPQFGNLETACRLNMQFLNIFKNWKLE